MPEEEEALATELYTELSTGSGSLTPTLRLLIKEQQEVSRGPHTSSPAPASAAGGAWQSAAQLCLGSIHWWPLREEFRADAAAAPPLCWRRLHTT